MNRGGEENTYREDNVKMESEIGVTQPQAKRCQGLPETIEARRKT